MEKEILTIEQAAEYLQIGKRSLYKLRCICLDMPTAELQGLVNDEHDVVKRRRKANDERNMRMVAVNGFGGSAKRSIGRKIVPTKEAQKTLTN